MPLLPVAYPRAIQIAVIGSCVPNRLMNTQHPSKHTRTHIGSCAWNRLIHTYTHSDSQLNSQQAYVPQVSVWNPFLLYGEIIVNPSVQMQIGLGGEISKEKLFLTLHL